jgi:hypothetical protein
MSGGTAVAFERLLHEASSGLREARREIVRDEAGWARLWAEIHDGVTPLPPRPAVDFTRHMLIAVALGTRRSGGFDVAVQAVAVREGRLEVRVLESCPPPGARTSMALTQPVEVVRVEALGQTPSFRDTRAASCR